MYIGWRVVGCHLGARLASFSHVWFSASVFYIWGVHFSKINRFRMVPRWSWCSPTPSATSTSSTMASTASTSYFHKKLTWHMFISFFQRQIDLKQCWRDLGAINVNGNPVVKIVVEDFGADMKRFLALYHVSSSFRYRLSLSQIGPILGPDPIAKRSSA